MEGQTGGAAENTNQDVWGDGWGRANEVLKIEEITETNSNEKNEGETRAPRRAPSKPKGTKERI